MKALIPVRLFIYTVIGDKGNNLNETYFLYNPAKLFGQLA